MQVARIERQVGHIVRVGLASLAAVAISPPTWAQQTETSQFDPCPSCSGIGHVVAIDGEFALIGEYSEGIYFYRREPGGWVQESAFRAPEVGDWFGISASLDGDRAAVGAYRAASPHGPVGAVYTFERVAGEWLLESKLQPQGLRSFDQFGRSVCLSDDRLAVGAPGVDSPVFPANQDNAGRVYVFERSSGSWLLEEQLDYPPDIDLYLGSVTGLGLSVDMSGDIIAAGAPHNVGGVFVWEREQHGWKRKALFQDPSPENGEQFGFSVAVDGRSLVVGSPADGLHTGRAHVFEKDHLGTWSHTAALKASDGYVGPGGTDNFGTAVAIDAHHVLVGAPRGNYNGIGTGTAYLFRRNASWKWNATETERYVASDASGQLGIAVDLSGTTALCGSPNAADDLHGKGYIFEIELGVEYCDPNTNSLGVTAHLALTGSNEPSEKPPIFSITGALPLNPVVAIVAPGGDSGANVPLGDGRFCLDATASHRFFLGSTGDHGSLYEEIAAETVDVLLPGTTWSFQALYRDPAVGSFNLTNAVAMTFD